jgi:antitoxin component YwqK of YwqJK toxin-antitoxin module
MKRTNLLSLVSVLVFTIFIFLAIGTECSEPQISQREDGKTEVTREFIRPSLESHKEISIGTTGYLGLWDGEVKTFAWDLVRGDYLVAIENYKNGKRHGRQLYYDRDGRIREEVCYNDDGERIPCTNQSNKSEYVLNEPTVPQKDYYSGRSLTSNFTFLQNKISLFQSVISDKNWLKYFQRNAKARRSVYYNMIRRINPPNIQNKFDSGSSSLSYTSGITEVSSYGYLRYESPWYIFFVEMFDEFDSTHVMAFIADIEDSISVASPLNETEITFAYMDVLEAVGENHDIIGMHQFIVEREAAESMKSYPLRLAVLDRLITYPEKSTYEVLEDNYPDFLTRWQEGVNDNDAIKAFTDYLDSVMVTLSDDEEFPDIDDPLFVWFIDLMLFGTLFAMTEEEIHADATGVLFYLIIESAVTADPVYQAVKATYQPVSVENDRIDKPGLPEQISLEQNYPNPFNPSTVIRYSIHQQLHTRLNVYDISGREVATLVDEIKNPGYYEIAFDASLLPSGVYIYRLQAGEYVESRKMLLLK